MQQHPAHLRVENFIFEGPAGKLEGLFESQQDSVSVASAVICHPHPLHGGTMHNKVVYTLARAFIRQQFNVLRFNFRGTGQSEGEYGNEQGELLDVCAAIQWVQEREPDLPIWLAGFSFGAVMTIHASLETKLEGLISIAPAVSRCSNHIDSQPDCPWLIIHGDQDELVNIEAIVEWLNKLEPGPALSVFQDTTHFFHGKLGLLRQTVESFVKDNRA